MKVDKQYFHTQDEAKAFVSGVEYVNDSQLRVLDIKKRKDFEDGEENAFVVRIQTDAK